MPNLVRVNVILSRVGDIPGVCVVVMSGGLVLVYRSLSRRRSIPRRLVGSVSAAALRVVGLVVVNVGLGFGCSLAGRGVYRCALRDGGRGDCAVIILQVYLDLVRGVPNVLNNLLPLGCFDSVTEYQLAA